MKLNYKRTILVGFAFFLISAFWQAYDAIIPLALTNHFGLPQSVSGVVMSIDNVLAVFLLPVFGAVSDKIMTRFGKRTPFIVLGTVAAVLAFITLTLVDNYQVNTLIEAGIIGRFDAAKLAESEATEAIKAATLSGDASALEAARAALAAAEATLSEISADILNVTIGNVGTVIAFVAVLLVVLLAMATFRSPAVALMPDVTVKPLRSKGNAIINLMGTAGGILVLVLGIVFGTAGKPYMLYTGYVLAVCGIMLVGLFIFIFKVRENKWVAEMEEESRRLGLTEEVVSDQKGGPVRRLSGGELRSLLLILASVALWYVGYNSITSKYTVYAQNVLGFDFNMTLIIAQAAAVVSYIPVGIIASKLGRRKTILAGILLLASAFFVGNFINPDTPEFVMIPVFVLAGMGWATINVNSFPMVVELAKGGDTGKYTGYYYTASMSAQIVAPILSGMLYDLCGMRNVFFAFGTVFVLLSFATMFFVRHGDSVPTAAEVREEMAEG